MVFHTVFNTMVLTFELVEYGQARQGSLFCASLFLRFWGVGWGGGGGNAGVGSRAGKQRLVALLLRV